MKEIGKQMKLIREELKISVYKIEKDIGIKHENIYRWENGKIEPSITSCIKLANYYNISLDDLVGRNFFKK